MATALAYAVGGASDFTARLAPALMGTAMVALPLFARRQLGRVAAYGAALLLAVSPSYLYYSRFAREDIHIAAITLALMVVAMRFLDRPRRWHPIALLALLAASFTVKESTLIFGFIAFWFIVGLLLVQTRAAGWRLLDGALVRQLRSLPWWTWVAGLAAFAFVFGTLFTALYTDWGGIWRGLYEGPDYWLNQHPVGRGGEPWFFYLAVLGGHEWPIVLLAAVGAVAVARDPRPFPLFLIWMVALSLAIYSWAGEKFAWLVLHPLLPLILLAGIGIQAIWRARRTRAGIAGLLAIAVGAAYLVGASWSVNAAGPTDPRELLVSTQSAPDTEHVRDRLLRLDRRMRAREKRRLSVTIDPHDGASFPWAWYLRDLSGSYDAAVRSRRYLPTADVLILTADTRALLLPRLGGYRGRRIDLRVWWVHDFHHGTPGAWWRWLTRREPWDPRGAFPEWVYVRRGIR